jgi:hypothetical protein
MRQPSARLDRGQNNEVSDGRWFALNRIVLDRIVLDRIILDRISGHGRQL